MEMKTDLPPGSMPSKTSTKFGAAFKRFTDLAQAFSGRSLQRQRPQVMRNERDGHLLNQVESNGLLYCRHSFHFARWPSLPLAFKLRRVAEVAVTSILPWAKHKMLTLTMHRRWFWSSPRPSIRMLVGCLSWKSYQAAWKETQRFVQSFFTVHKAWLFGIVDENPVGSAHSPLSDNKGLNQRDTTSSSSAMSYESYVAGSMATN